MGRIIGYLLFVILLIAIFFLSMWSNYIGNRADKYTGKCAVTCYKKYGDDYSSEVIVAPDGSFSGCICRWEIEKKVVFPEKEERNEEAKK